VYASPVSATGSPATAAAPERRVEPWLVSAPWDIGVFGGSAALAFGLLLAGHLTGALQGELPAWAWIVTIVGVDVAHVWSTAWRVYLDPRERERRPGLYLALPLGAYVAGVLLYSAGHAVFWRALAYVAVFHFVRQQYGWVALYRRRLGESSRLDRLLDGAAIYSATLYPLLYWHAHLPREFEWFVAGDFIPGLPPLVAEVALPLHLAITAAYALRQAWLWRAGRPVSPGKNLVMATTWLTWYVGIVALDSDYAFTVTNVLVHGIPYMAFVWIHGRSRWKDEGAGIAHVFRPWRFSLYLAPLLLIAWLEEWGWDRLLWHERGSLFPGADVMLGPPLLALVVPLLALPQATHYLLDAWIWRVRPENPSLGAELGISS
jgi:hypothetical protein